MFTYTRHYTNHGDYFSCYNSFCCKSLSLSLSLSLFPSKFNAVELNQREELTLNKKLEQFGLPTLPSGNEKNTSTHTLDSEPYSEEGAKREISLSEKELNALLAKNTDLSDKLAIDLAGNLASFKILIPLDADFPVLGGKTLKVSAGAELGCRKIASSLH